MREVLRDLHVKAGSPTVDNLKEHSERSGHSVELVLIHQGFGGLDLPPLGFQRQCRTCVDGLVVEHHRAGPAFHQDR